MRSLLGNRKDLTPQQSMEHLVKYARDQDNANFNRRARFIRASVFMNFAFFGALSAYIIKEIYFGYWLSIYPRNAMAMVIDIVVLKKRQLFTPEIYLKDLERMKKDLMNKNLTALKNPEVQEEGAHH